MPDFQECFVLFYMQQEVMAGDEVKLVNVSWYSVITRSAFCVCLPDFIYFFCNIFSLLNVESPFYLQFCNLQYFRFLTKAVITFLLYLVI